MHTYLLASVIRQTCWSLITSDVYQTTFRSSLYRRWIYIVVRCQWDKNWSYFVENISNFILGTKKSQDFKVSCKIILEKLKIGHYLTCPCFSLDFSFLTLNWEKNCKWVFWGEEFSKPHKKCIPNTVKICCVMIKCFWVVKKKSSKILVISVRYSECFVGVVVLDWVFFFCSIPVASVRSFELEGNRWWQTVSQLWTSWCSVMGSVFLTAGFVNTSLGTRLTFN